MSRRPLPLALPARSLETPHPSWASGSGLPIHDWPRVFIDPIGSRTSHSLIERLGPFHMFQVVEKVGVKIAVRVVFAMMSFLNQPIPQDVEHRLGEQEDGPVRKSASDHLAVPARPRPGRRVNEWKESRKSTAGRGMDTDAASKPRGPRGSAKRASKALLSTDGPAQSAEQKQPASDER